MGAARERASEAAPEPERDLSGLDRQILEFERGWWRLGGAKDSAITETFGMTSTRYYQRLNVLIDTPEALAADPMLVKRLRRLREARQQARQQRRLADFLA